MSTSATPATPRANTPSDTSAGADHNPKPVYDETDYLHLGWFVRNRYPGRVVIAGLSLDGKSVIIVTMIMGRSENSRNRIYRACDGKICTEPAKEMPDQDTSLIIYTTMSWSQDGTCIVASNGAQTDTALEGKTQPLNEALANWTFEPDAPNYTPRITVRVVISNNEPTFEALTIFRTSVGDREELYETFETGAANNGTGWALTTYLGDGNPLPANTTGVACLPLPGNTASDTLSFYCRLMADNPNLISIAVYCLPIVSPGEDAVPGTVAIYNRYEQTSGGSSVTSEETWVTRCLRGLVQFIRRFF